MELPTDNLSENGRIALLTAAAAVALLTVSVGSVAATTDAGMVLISAALASPIPGDSVAAYYIASGVTAGTGFITGPTLTLSGGVRNLALMA